MPILTRYQLVICPHTQTKRLIEQGKNEEVPCEYIRYVRRWEGELAKPIGRAGVFLMDDEIIVCQCECEKRSYA